jgi:hypothetical protein
MEIGKSCVSKRGRSAYILTMTTRRTGRTVLPVGDCQQKVAAKTRKSWMSRAVRALVVLNASTIREIYLYEVLYIAHARRPIYNK